MTRFEKMKEMNLGELANFLCDEQNDDCEHCVAFDLCRMGHLGMREYLEEELEE